MYIRIGNIFVLYLLVISILFIISTKYYSNYVIATGNCDNSHTEGGDCDYKVQCGAQYSCTQCSCGGGENWRFRTWWNQATWHCNDQNNWDCNNTPGGECQSCGCDAICPGGPTDTPIPLPSKTPTPRPIRTPTPIAGNTPTSTVTSIPSLTPTNAPTQTPIYTPTNTPSPTPIATCQCSGMDYSGLLSSGQVVTFTSHAKPDNNNFEVGSIVFHVEKDGQEIATSMDIPAQRELDNNGDPTNRYYATWDYLIPSNLSGVVNFRVWSEIKCGYKIAQNINSESAVLAVTSEKNNSIVNRLYSFFTTIFSTTSNKKNQSPIQQAVTRVSNFALQSFNLFNVVIPTQPPSLKLSWFIPAQSIVPGCDDIKFSVSY